MIRVIIDFGYSSAKILYNGEYYKVPTAISFANDAGIQFGESSVYDYQGDKYYVGEAATDEAFTTTDYEFLKKFGPLMAFHILKKLNLLDQDIELITGLALTDWDKRQDFQDTLQFLKVNDATIATNCKVVMPQGSGAYNAYIAENNLYEAPPKTMVVIDIGYRTINFLYYEKGVANQTRMKGFPGHGIVSIMKTFSNYLETTYGMPFSEQEALKIFMDKELSLGGVPQEEIPVFIADLKIKFMQKLRNSILVSEKKTLGFADKVLMAGGGAYYIEDMEFPPNIVFNKNPKEFSNVFGYSLI